ncbi:MAG TPA: ethanolamine ammonia-lyase subunit EutC [Candidatus Binataceae bacterium]|nr:ethanolamine ammonia-lyase subunit EutC [Candidatus Binataceae bacterium]
MNDGGASDRALTPARLGVGRAGTRYTTASMLKFRADHARALDAVTTEVSGEWPRKNGLIEFHSEVATREEYLLHPERGRRLRRNEIAKLRTLNPPPRKAKAASKPSVLIFIGDGLSSVAVEANAAPLLNALIKQMRGKHHLLKAFFIRNARVRIEDHLGEILKPEVVCMIVGERPGLATAESLSAYMIYRPRLSSMEPDRTVISNIHRGGIPIAEAATKIAALIDDAIRLRATGAKLAALLTE